MFKMETKTWSDYPEVDSDYWEQDGGHDLNPIIMSNKSIELVWENSRESIVSFDRENVVKLIEDLQKILKEYDEIEGE